MYFKLFLDEFFVNFLLVVEFIKDDILQHTCSCIDSNDFHFSIKRRSWLEYEQLVYDRNAYLRYTISCKNNVGTNF